MKVKALINIPKTVDGKPMGPYTKGQEYEMDTEKATLFIGSAMAEEVLPPPPPKKEEKKKDPPPPPAPPPARDVTGRNRKAK